MTSGSACEYPEFRLLYTFHCSPSNSANNPPVSAGAAVPTQSTPGWTSASAVTVLNGISEVPVVKKRQPVPSHRPRPSPNVPAQSLPLESNCKARTPSAKLSVKLCHSPDARSKRLIPTLVPNQTRSPSGRFSIARERIQSLPKPEFRIVNGVHRRPSKTAAPDVRPTHK